MSQTGICIGGPLRIDKYSWVKDAQNEAYNTYPFLLILLFAFSSLPPFLSLFLMFTICLAPIKGLSHVYN